MVLELWGIMQMLSQGT